MISKAVYWWTRSGLNQNHSLLVLYSQWEQRAPSQDSNLSLLAFKAFLSGWLFWIMCPNFWPISFYGFLCNVLWHNSQSIKFTLSSVEFRIFSILWICAIFTTNSGTWKSSPKGALSSLAVTPYFPLTRLLAATNLLSFSGDLPILDISHKENQTRRGLLCLASLT